KLKLELENVLSTCFPTFVNLITLEVSIIKAQQVRTLFSFLHFSPNLESLVFGRVIFPDEVNEDALTLDVVPHCLLMHLKSIEFRDFEGQRGGYNSGYGVYYTHASIGQFLSIP
ncbi:hypothetical protein MKW94_011848, partial [Papaver nudicaule]|nr:hypothetical protein [Papaver nudicaule]